VVEFDFVVESIDLVGKMLLLYDGCEVFFDLFVMVLFNMGVDFVVCFGFGDDFNYVLVDCGILCVKVFDNIFVIGDVLDILVFKVGLVVYFVVEIFVDNFLDEVVGCLMVCVFDGYVNCFIESGYGKGLFIDFNYDIESLFGWFFLFVVGLLSLLKEM